MYERDLANSTEVVLKARKLHSVERRRKPRIEELAHPRPQHAPRRRRRRHPHGPHPRRRADRRREVGPAEAINLFWSSLIFLVLGLLALFVPRRSRCPLA